MESYELRIDDLVIVTKVDGKHIGRVKELYCRSAHVWCGEEWASVYVNRYPYTQIEPIHLTADILKANGWEDIAGRFVLRTGKEGAFYKLKNRLGYNPATGELVVNYGSVPVKVLYVHELQHILCDCGLKEYADNFKML